MKTMTTRKIMGIAAVLALGVGIPFAGFGAGGATPQATSPTVYTKDFVAKYTSSTSQTTTSSIFDNGNVGIGTTAPAAKLHLYSGTSHAELRAQTAFADATHVPAVSVKNPSQEWSFALTDANGLNIRENSASYASRMYLMRGGNVGIGTTNPGIHRFVSRNTPTTAGEFQIRGEATTGQSVGIIAGAAVGSYNDLTSAGATALIFTGSTGKVDDPNAKLVIGPWSSSQSGLTINSSGSVGIGTNAPTQKFHVVGKVIADDYLYNSDSRLKADIAPLENAANGIACLDGVTYRWADPKRDQNLQVGLIAQDVEACYPELVETDANGNKSVSYARLVAPLIEAVKDQQQVSRELKTELTRTQAALAATNARLVRIEASLKLNR